MNNKVILSLSSNDSEKVEDKIVKLACKELKNYTMELNILMSKVIPFKSHKLLYINKKDLEVISWILESNNVSVIVINELEHLEDTLRMMDKESD